MSEQKPNEMLDHNYDGIQEYDNPLPTWWVWIFWATIVFSLVYFIYYHILMGPTMHDEYAAEVESWDARMAELIPPTASEGDLQAILADPAKVQAGGAVFAAKCLPCHAADGGGMVGLGPNMTDNYWKNGDGSLSAIQKVVISGVTGTAMQAWEQQLKPDELVNVVAFVKSLQGTTPANPKEPEGQLVGAAAADSTAQVSDSSALETASK
ncbi:MAG: cbb3-type cytochrome c oxidase N-terminal domain-containing protein [Candidatus Delongbacteria bacterium]